MLPIVADPALVAACGLFCGACRKHRAGKCPGCRQNEKLGGCEVRGCCLEQGYATCADCVAFYDPRDCARFASPIARAVGLVLRSDRAACIDRIHEVGRDAFACEMAAARAVTIRR